jgi:hypothetical protein
MPVRARRSAKKSVAERRAAVRANRTLTIQHRLFRSHSSKFVTEWLLSTTKNMSVTGLLFFSHVPYKVGDIIELEVTMSGVIEVLKGFAKVVRVIKNAPVSYDIAVKLVDLKPRSRSAKSHLKQ